MRFDTTSEVVATILDPHSGRSVGRGTLASAGARLEALV
jgi:hypothetical protein